MTQQRLCKYPDVRTALPFQRALTIAVLRFSRDNPILRVTLSLEKSKPSAALKNRAFATSCWSRGNIEVVSNNYLKIASPRCMRLAGISLESAMKRRIPPLVERARTGWWFIRKLMTAKFMRTCTPPGRNAIRLADRNARARYAADSGARISPLTDWPTGVRSYQRGGACDYCCGIAGRRNDDFAAAAAACAANSSRSRA